ncbi:uncharacterized protein TrAFT101_009624 [Trichoderma asperellum]|uniref:uncharacterized protein n=1 Tax=Trichoderma asperellum TaxID=101201 RepID=UPI00332E454F|nr:hypothetical protein TrAFT101_009624 [Trichoderma asperellum]
MTILRKFLIGNVAFQAALALPGPPVNHGEHCKITKVKEVVTTKHWPWWTQTRTDYTTKTALPSTKTVTSDATQIDYQTDFAPTTITSTSTATVSITVFTSTETDTVTSTATSTTTTIATTAAVISPSPAISNDQTPSKRDNRGYYPPPPPSCETIYKTERVTVWVPTVAHKTVTKTKTVTPAAVTKTVASTGTNTVTTTLPSTVTSIALATATNTISAVTTTTTTATTTTTQTVAATPTYALSWDQDTCGYAFAHIIDVEIAGDEQTVIDSCANMCTQDSNCLLWEAYYHLSDASGRCATFADAYDSGYLQCPDSYGIGYSVGAQKLGVAPLAP